MADIDNQALATVNEDVVRDNAINWIDIWGDGNMITHNSGENGIDFHYEIVRKDGAYHPTVHALGKDRILAFPKDNLTLDGAKKICEEHFKRFIEAVTKNTEVI